VTRKIGKTRQRKTVESEEVFDAAVGKARGVLRRPPPAGKFRHGRVAAPEDLAAWVENYWMVKWDLRGLAPYVAETLPHPSFHLVFEDGKATVSGVFLGKFSRTLHGASHVFGVKFHAGAFRKFLKEPASALVNRTVPAQRIFGKEVTALAAVIVSCASEREMAEAAGAFLRRRLPDADGTMMLARQMVGRILAEREIKTVEDLVGRLGMGKRRVQRIFQEYVGVHPKWVIRRYRLHELTERIQSGEELDWAGLALELGYFDQAHLINDFGAIVGCSPVEYRRQVRRV
jgi:AraC-like DNA-binding protein